MESSLVDHSFLPYYKYHAGLRTHLSCKQYYHPLTQTLQETSWTHDVIWRIAKPLNCFHFNNYRWLRFEQVMTILYVYGLVLDENICEIQLKVTNKTWVSLWLLYLTAEGFNWCLREYIWYTPFDSFLMMITRSHNTYCKSIQRSWHGNALHTTCLLWMECDFPLKGSAMCCFYYIFAITLNMLLNNQPSCW